MSMDFEVSPVPIGTAPFIVNVANAQNFVRMTALIVTNGKHPSNTTKDNLLYTGEIVFFTGFYFY